MRVIGDFHIHSRYAMACSRDITIESLDQAAVTKGINVLGTGDFTHPMWLKEIKSALEEDGSTGLFKLKGKESKTRFMLSSEVSTIFTFGEKVRKIHNCILLSSIESVVQLNDQLRRYGSLEMDGRPQLSMPAAELVEILFEIDRNAFLFPAHAWTPYFGVFGSISGFDTMKEAYQDQEYRIHALETGLSSDPAMNWRISALDKYALLSNSDMHSVGKMGREANVFELEENKVTYNEIIDAITKKDKKRFVKTIEFYPEEGKYHFDGHRNCNFSNNPEEKNLERCPICGKKLVLGVLHRIGELADRKTGEKPKETIPYDNVIPLNEIIGEVSGRGPYTQSVKKTYDELIAAFGTEFDVLENASEKSMADVAGEEVAKGVMKMRKGDVSIVPGYDGVYGVVSIARTAPPEKPAIRQKSILDFDGK
jgi:uncharacterized protein (TIGR00375 family)